MKRIVSPVALDHLGRHRRVEASRATPARSSRDPEVVPSAEASASASRVGPGRPEILARRSSSSVPGTASGAAGSMSASSTRASSSAKNGFPPDRSWMRSSVCRAKGLRSRSRRRRWSAPTLSGPTASRSVPSAPSACSRAVGSALETLRRASSRSTRPEPSLRKRERERERRRGVEPLKIVDREEKRRSLRRAPGWRCGSRCRAPAGPPPPRPRPRRGVRPRVPAVSAARGRAAPRPARPRTDRRGRRERGSARPRQASTRGRGTPAPCACSTPSSQIVDFPIPALALEHERCEPGLGPAEELANGTRAPAPG